MSKAARQAVIFVKEAWHQLGSPAMTSGITLCSTLMWCSQGKSRGTLFQSYHWLQAWTCRPGCCCKYVLIRSLPRHQHIVYSIATLDFSMETVNIMQIGTAGCCALFGGDVRVTNRGC